MGILVEPFEQGVYRPWEESTSPKVDILEPIMTRPGTNLWDDLWILSRRVLDIVSTSVIWDKQNFESLARLLYLHFSKDARKPLGEPWL